MGRDRRGFEGVACEQQLSRQPLHVYTYLWTKPELLNDHCGRFRFVLTDTVLFKHQKPTRWLFTSHQDKGKILSKHKKHLTAASVLQEFLAPKLPPSPPVHEEERILATYTYLERSSCSGEVVMVVEHLSQAALTHLLLVRDKPSESVLQRFIPTKSGFNHTIQVVYTPEICTVRKCVNPNMMSDLKFSPLQRTVTFEDKDLADRSRTYTANEDGIVGDVSSKDTRKQIEQMATEISTHLQKIVGKDMVRNVSYFKIGSDNRIYLLWSTMLSFEHASRAFAKNHKLSLSTHEKHVYDISNYALVCRSQQLLGIHAQLRCCPSCKHMLPRSQVSFMVTYKSIIQLCEAEHSQKDYPDDQDRIPKLIKNAVGSMPFDRFEQLKRTTAFQYQTIQMCHACAQAINIVAMKQAQPESPPPRKASLTQPKNESNVSLENANAHELFWAKADREEARRGRQQPFKTDYRPSSAKEVRILFRSTRLKKLKPALPSNQDTPNHTLPRIGDGTDTIIAHNYEGSEFVVKMARHLQRRYGRPSTRYALAQCGIFPQGPSVAIRTLEALGTDSAVLAGVAAHWTALNFASGHEANRSEIDIDALDGLLSARIYRSKDASDVGSCARQSPVKQHDTRAPARPIRPKSCSMSSRSSRQARSATIHSSPELKPRQMADPDDVPADSRRPDHQDQEQQSTRRLRRVFDGVEYFMDVCALQPASNNASGVFSLYVRAVKVSKDEKHSTPMELVLNTEQILLLVGRGASDLQDPQAALSSEDAMIHAVLQRLVIRNGALEYQDLIAVTDEELSSPELTDDEWLVLQQTLAQS